MEQRAMGRVMPMKIAVETRRVPCAHTSRKILRIRERSRLPTCCSPGGERFRELV